jgi:hypothetical protein
VVVPGDQPAKLVDAPLRRRGSRHSAEDNTPLGTAFSCSRASSPR